jgi:hypothetical protein
MLDRFVADLSDLFGDDLVCIVTRTQRWSRSDENSPEVLLIVVWDTVLTNCQMRFGQYIAANLRELRPTDLVGYQQFEQSIYQGVPASIHTVITGNIIYDPKDLFLRLQRSVNLDRCILSKKNLEYYLSQKSRGHYQNIFLTLQRLLAEMYLAAEASLQYHWVNEQDEITYRKILEVATWDSITGKMNIKENNPDAFDLIDSFISGLRDLDTNKEVSPYLTEVLRAAKKLDALIDRNLET